MRLRSGRIIKQVALKNGKTFRKKSDGKSLQSNEKPKHLGKSTKRRNTDY
jgi:hypothetical protein